MSKTERVKFKAEINGMEKLIVKDRFKIVYDGKTVGGHMSATVFAADIDLETPFRKTLSFSKSEYGRELREGIFEHDIVSFSYNGSNHTGVIVDDEDMRISYVLEDNGKKYPLYRISTITVIGSTLLERADSTIMPEGFAYASKQSEKICLDVYTDGSALSNPGPCGFAYAIVKDGELISENSSSLGTGTNNIAELTAVIEGIQAALSRHPDRITVYSDSRYVVDGITKWYKGWLKRGWVNSAGDSVKNRELWEKLIDIKKGIDIDFKWVRGHNDNRFNERCDFLAQEAARICG